jgi:GT2 family glycosyltransferase
MTDVDVVILDLDGGARLEACLASIASQSRLPGRVIVFDNGSKEPATTRVSSPGGLRIEHVRSEVNLGFAGGMNAALTGVRAPFVAMINNDVMLDREWLASNMAAIESDDRVAAVQSAIRRDAETIDGAGIDISDGTYRQASFGSPIAGASPGQPWGISATAAIFRMDALRQVSGTAGAVFIPRFFAWYEDVELNARLRYAGWAVRLVPRPLATHAGSATSAVLGRRALRLRVRNRYFVNRLHRDVGRRSALLREDMGRLLRAVRKLRIIEVLVIAVAVIEGNMVPLRSDP